MEEGPFQYMSMNLIMDLPRSESYDAILMIINQGCSKATKFIPCNKMIDAEGVAREYLCHLVPWFSLPKQIISDCDPCFASQFSQTLCHNLGIQQNILIVFHPRTDGQMERMNTWVEGYLRHWTTGRQTNWATLLSMAEYAHNLWKHEVTKASPHKLLLGLEPQVNVKFLSDIAPIAVNRLHTLKKQGKRPRHN
jgi:hypothetical protein